MAESSPPLRTGQRQRIRRHHMVAGHRRCQHYRPARGHHPTDRRHIGNGDHHRHPSIGSDPDCPGRRQPGAPVPTSGSAAATGELTDIAGATTDSYTPLDSDHGDRIRRCRDLEHDPWSDLRDLGATTLVSGVAPSVASVTVSGSAVTGQRLTATASRGPGCPGTDHRHQVAAQQRRGYLERYRKRHRRRLHDRRLRLTATSCARSPPPLTPRDGRKPPRLATGGGGHQRHHRVREYPEHDHRRSDLTASAGTTGGTPAPTVAYVWQRVPATAAPVGPTFPAPPAARTFWWPLMPTRPSGRGHREQPSRDLLRNLLRLGQDRRHHPQPSPRPAFLAPPPCQGQTLTATAGRPPAIPARPSRVSVAAPSNGTSGWPTSPAPPAAPTCSSTPTTTTTCAVATASNAMGSASRQLSASAKICCDHPDDRLSQHLRHHHRGSDPHRHLRRHHRQSQPGRWTQLAALQQRHQRLGRHHRRHQQHLHPWSRPTTTTTSAPSPLPPTTSPAAPLPTGTAPIPPPAKVTGPPPPHDRPNPPVSPAHWRHRQRNGSDPHRQPSHWRHHRQSGQPDGVETLTASGNAPARYRSGWEAGYHWRHQQHLHPGRSRLQQVRPRAVATATNVVGSASLQLSASAKIAGGSPTLASVTINANVTIGQTITATGVARPRVPHPTVTYKGNAPATARPGRRSGATSSSLHTGRSRQGQQGAGNRNGHQLGRIDSKSATTAENIKLDRSDLDIGSQPAFALPPTSISGFHALV